MSYEDGIAKKTGRIGEDEADKFLEDNGFSKHRPAGRDIGIDRLVSLPERTNKEARIQVKGRGQIANPRWFQLTVPGAQVRDAFEEGKDLEELWERRIYQVDFWVLVSIPAQEVWVFPSEVIFEIAETNNFSYRSRRDNQYDKPHYDKKGKIQKKQKELNLDVKDESGIPLREKFQRYRDNAECLYAFFD